ncbi:MAG: hypothetical protein ACKOQ4_14900 [Mycobacterium sp.]
MRGLALALGVGAALLAGSATAAAAPVAPDSTASDPTDAGASAPARIAKGPLAARRSVGAPRPRVASRVARAAAAAQSQAAASDTTPRNRADRVAPQRRADRVLERVIASAATHAVAKAEPGITAPLPGPSAAVAPVPPAATVVPGLAAALRPRASSPAAGAIRTPAVAPMLHGSPRLAPADTSTTASVALLAFTAVIQFAVVTAVAALTPAPPSPAGAGTSLPLNGFDVVPSSDAEITSFYGRWTYLPGAPSLVQGRQQFDLVDPTTSESIGSFDALVSRGTGIDYVTLLVTATDATNVGPGAGQIPPVGSLVSHFQIGQIGLSYSAMPSASGDNVVSFTITTPKREFELAVPFDAAKGIADRTVDNRPIELGNGYSIAPADPDGETFTAISGILPLFTTVQGNQTFNVYDSAGKPVGSFDGVFTTTSDIIGTYTQAILVTASDGTNVGTAAGQVPPVGSVYNVIYRESDEHFFLYSSLPSPSGDEISVIEVDHGTVTNSALTLINASEQPVYESLLAADGYRFVPTSELRPSGINGLPPRDVQVQGYQQFDVFDSAGTRIGSVDADVATQWDAFGIHSKALLVTRVTEGSPGGGPGEIPPPGSVFNFLTSGDSGFKSAHAVVPSPFGDTTSFEIATALGEIPLPSSNVPAAARTKVTFFSPFQSV